MSRVRDHGGLHKPLVGTLFPGVALHGGGAPLGPP